MTLPATFWAKVTKTDTCWLWTACLTSRGYGCFSLDGKRHLAHRLVYADLIGPIPDGFTIDHVYANGCRHKNCVNPDHLEAVTQLENSQRYFRLIRTCPNNHLLTYREGDRQRRCRPCEAERKRARRQELVAAA